MFQIRAQRRPALTLLAISLALSLTACSKAAVSAGSSGSGSGSSGDTTLALNVYSKALPYYQDLIRGAQDQAKESKVTLNVTYGQTDPQLQYNQVQNAISTAPDGLIVAPIDQVVLIPLIQQASQSNLPVVTVGDNIAPEGQQYQLTFVGNEYVEVGRQKAQFIVDALGGHGTVGVIHGIRGLHFSEAQAEGAKEVFAQNPGVTVIDGPYTGEFTSDAGLAAAENMLTANPNIDALYMDNDDLALGAILAAQQRNIAMDKIIIVGTDGGAPAREAVGRGELDMSISLCGYATGREAVSVLTAKVQDGVQPDPSVPVPTLTLTPDTLAAAQQKIDAGQC